MKKCMLLFAVVLCLSACAGQKQTLTLDEQSALRTCLMNESLKAVQNGTAFTADLSDLAQSIATTCVRKQALENLGMDEQSAQWAQNILTAVSLQP